MLTPDPGALGFLITTSMGVPGVGDVVSCDGGLLLRCERRKRGAAHWSRMDEIPRGSPQAIRVLSPRRWRHGQKRKLCFEPTSTSQFAGTKVGLILRRKLSARYQSDSLRQLLFSLVSGVDLDVVPVPRVQPGRVWLRSPCVEVFVRIVVVVAELDADVSVRNLAGNCP